MRKTAGYTLMELLTVITVVVIVAPLVGKLFTDGWIASHRTIRRIENNQIVPILMKSWQKTLANTSPETWHTENNVFRAESFSTSQNGKHLVINNGQFTKKLLLPSGSECVFSIERYSDMADCAIMQLSWISTYMRKKQTNQVRFVACGGKK